MRCAAPEPFKGKVIRIVEALGRCVYGSVSEESGLKVKGMVVEEPERVVAAWVMWEEVRRGSRKVDVQPAPRMRREIGSGGVEDGWRTDGAWVLSVIFASDRGGWQMVEVRSWLSGVWEDG